MPSHNVCYNFCFKSKYSSIAIVISIHTAPVLYTVMEIVIQIPVSNSVTSSQLFFLSLYNLSIIFFKEYAENFNLAYEFLSIKKIRSWRIKDLCQLSFYGQL